MNRYKRLWMQPVRRRLPFKQVSERAALTTSEQMRAIVARPEFGNIQENEPEKSVWSQPRAVDISTRIFAVRKDILANENYRHPASIGTDQFRHQQRIHQLF